MLTVLAREFTHSYASFNGRYRPFLTPINSSSLPKTKMLKELIGISVVTYPLLRLVFDSINILATW
jgi:hypothetical protein